MRKKWFKNGDWSFQSSIHVCRILTNLPNLYINTPYPLTTHKKWNCQIGDSRLRGKASQNLTFAIVLYCILMLRQWPCLTDLARAKKNIWVNFLLKGKFLQRRLASIYKRRFFVRKVTRARIILLHRVIQIFYAPEREIKENLGACSKYI